MKYGKFHAALVTALIAALVTICSCASDPGSGNKYDEDYLAKLMQNFVISISKYARSIKPGFIIIPQNGSELAFHDTNPGVANIMDNYVKAIDGIGIEELFYNGSLDIDRERLANLNILKTRVGRIMVSDLVSDTGNIPNAIQRNTDCGFIAFPRSQSNLHYGTIPAYIPDIHTDGISKLSEARNYLYLINADNYADKNSLLAAVKNTNFDVVLIDLFFIKDDTDIFTADDVLQLKTKKSGGKRLVISYINIGSIESFRYYWKPEWKKGSPSWIVKNYQGYPDEYWIEYWHPDWMNIIYGNDNSYIKKIIDAGFDGAYLDNTEAYYSLAH